MIVSEELRRWLQDRSAQRAARLAADDFARRWNDGTVQARFGRATAALPDRTAEAVAAAAAELLADDDWVETLLAQMSEAACREPYFEPPFRHLNSGIHTGLVLFEDDNLSIALGVSRIAELAAHKNAPRGKASIAFSGQVSVFRFVKAGQARLAFWEAPLIGADFRGETAGRCRPTAARDIEDGETLIVDGRHQSFVIEHAHSNLFLLQATVKPGQAPVSVEYDAETRQYVGCSAADDSASRIQMITTLLRKLDCAAAVPALAELLGHPHFFVRWHVMRELLGLDAGTALPHLKRMAARDPHPETRQAARAALDYVESRAVQRKAA